ncbi:hypothetical protein EJ06DRAFT_559941 [Trichodelitschia bisporula]|uniref:F-box domain-containing protein n=1 Tax=Trichodelitschia bisporula TaxID=703511 RepID=A0A6G1HK35_9PEZI|nr:hypothetical protein EJ06DRAFT_559941 [Trichodelitschia bisporula]
MAYPADESALSLPPSDEDMLDVSAPLHWQPSPSPGAQQQPQSSTPAPSTPPLPSPTTTPPQRHSTRHRAPPAPSPKPSPTLTTPPSVDVPMPDAPPSPESWSHDPGVRASPLFRLPRELRDAIYSHCLTAAEAIPWPIANLSAGICTPLLRVCRAVHRETWPLLYAKNTLSFAHPSDANMFLYAHNRAQARMLKSLRLMVRDRDVRALWTGYLSSTAPGRSLMADYPSLEEVHVCLRMVGWAGHAAQGADVVERFRRWGGDRALKELCLSVEGRAPVGADVRVVMLYRVARGDVDLLWRMFPGKFQRRGGGVRTAWECVFGASVALEVEGVDVEGA